MPTDDGSPDPAGSQRGVREPDRVVLARRDVLRGLGRAALVMAGAAGTGGDSRRAASRDFEATTAVEWMRLLVDRVRAERLSPPVASRVYAYAGVAQPCTNTMLEGA